MAHYQIPVAISLGTCILLSAIFFALAKPADSEVKLLDITRDATTYDPFDVTTSEDLINGNPIGEERFWYKMRLRKMALTATLAVLLGMEITHLIYSVRQDSLSSSDVALYCTRIAFALYLAIVSAHAVKQEYSSHWRSILHLSCLTCLASFLLGTLAILPSQPMPTATSSVDSAPSLLSYLVDALYMVSCAIAATIPRGPPLHFPPERIYSDKSLASETSKDQPNVCGTLSASVWDRLFFLDITKVVRIANTVETLEISDLPIVPADMRATYIFATMRAATRKWKLQVRTWRPRPGSGWELSYRLVRVNMLTLIHLIIVSATAAVLYYLPLFFLQRLIVYLETDPERKNRPWGWLFSAGLFLGKVISQTTTNQLWAISSTTLQTRLKVQLNSILFAKTLVRRDIASSPSGSSTTANTNADSTGASKTDNDTKDEGENGFASKAQIMTLMTTDVDRVSEFGWHIFSLIDSPIEVFLGTAFLYHLLGVSCFVGLGIICLVLPLNHLAGKVVVGAQENLMTARDERVSLMNEILGGIRMLKFMAWERSFEARVSKVRDRELKYQKLNYTIETLWNTIWNVTPILVALVSFWHFAVYRGEVLTPSIAFTSLSVFSEMKFALSALPQTFINMIQSLVSLRRIEKYLQSPEVADVTVLNTPQTIALRCATVTWPQERTMNVTPSASTPSQKFSLVDLSLEFPQGKLSLVCGRLGSGKTLLLLALLGEAELLTGQLTCPRSPPDFIASSAGRTVQEDEWIVPGICAYVPQPQSAWLRNASIRDNILFNLPYVEQRYQKTLQVCALLADLEILEDGDMSEIGERGVTLSGGQKARVSLARAVYSRASILLLDDVLSAVDAHTARHIYHQCLKGDLMKDRTVILVSHHVQLCVPGASYIVALDNGRLQFAGDQAEFQTSGILDLLSQSGATDPANSTEETAGTAVEVIYEEHTTTTLADDASDSGSTSAPATIEVKVKPDQKRMPRKLIEEEQRAVGHVDKGVWLSYVRACGGPTYWVLFCFSLGIAAASPVLENGWLRIWSGSAFEIESQESPLYYVRVYAIIIVAGLVLWTLQWFVLYRGGIRASRVLHQRLLEGVLFADVRFHDTVSRGRLLNRFGKDFEGVDSNLPDDFGRTVMYGLAVATIFIVTTFVGGLPFLLAGIILVSLYYSAGKAYGRMSREMRRLNSVTRSPLYSMYGEAISGVPVIRAFGASSKLLRDMLRLVDTNTNPYYWTWGANRWLTGRFEPLGGAVIGIIAFISVQNREISASTAAFALAFAASLSNEITMLTRQLVGLELSMVALERIKEFSEVPRESPEFIEPRPASTWPANGVIKCENLVVRYAPDLPDVLHGINFEIKPGEKVGILGRTGSGKSTLALSFFRFVELKQGRILIDNVDTSKIGLIDLRSRLTIIPQDPTIMSGTLRSTLDVFNEYQDTEIYEALRRVHLIRGDNEGSEIVNANVFRNLDSPVSEGGENFSTGEKQLLCMARAILKRTKVLLMDEATASVDYATDELIGKTIRQEFAQSTILTIAHRLRTVIDYDRVMVLDRGRIAEFDPPAKLLADPTSKFYALCQATGKNEFMVLKRLAGVT